MAERSMLRPALASAVPALVPQGEQAGKPAMPLGRPFTLIGSRNRAHLHLLSSTVSRNHGCIVSTTGGFYVRDLASRTGLLVNGRKVREVDLRDGDLIQVGSFKFRFTDPSGTRRLPLGTRATPAMLEMGGTTFTPLDGRSMLIGRRPTCDIVLPEASVSNTHAIIFEIDGQRFIRDLGSRSGTLVNGRPVHHQPLQFGDEIHVGEMDFRYVAAEAPGEAAEADLIDDLEPEHDEAPIGLHFDEPSAAAAATLDVAEPAADPMPLDFTTEPETSTAPAADAALGAVDLEPIPLDLDEPPVAEPAVAAPIAEPELPSIGLDHAIAPLDDAPVVDVTPEPAHDTPAEAFTAPTLDEPEAAQPVIPAPQYATVDEAHVAPAFETAVEPAVDVEPAAPESEAPEPAAPADADEAPAEPQQEKVAEFDAQSPLVHTAAPTEPELSGPSHSTTELGVEDVDLSTVDFQRSEPPTAIEPELAEPTPPEPPTAAPLLNLDESPTVQADAPAETISDAPAIDAPTIDEASTAVEPPAEPVPVPSKGRKPRAPRKKPAGAAPATGRRGRSKPSLNDLASESSAVADAAPESVMPQEPAPQEVAAQARDATFGEPATAEPIVQEVVEPTEPTPDSAQPLEPQLAAELSAPEAAAAPPASTMDADASLSDTAFGRAVQELSEPDLGPLVEVPSMDQAQPSPAAEEHSLAADASALLESEPELAAIDLPSEEPIAADPFAALDLPPADAPAEDPSFASMDLGLSLGDPAPVTESPGALDAVPNVTSPDLNLEPDEPDLSLDLSIDPGTPVEPELLDTGEGSDAAGLAIDPLTLDEEHTFTTDLATPLPADAELEPTPGEAELAGPGVLEPSLDLESPPPGAATVDDSLADLLPDVGSSVSSSLDDPFELPDILTPEAAVLTPDEERLVELDRQATAARAAAAEAAAAAAARAAQAEAEADRDVDLIDEPPAAPPGGPVDPFFGMQRDSGSFVGGMPLALAPLPPAVAPAAPPAKPAAPPTPPRAPARPSLFNRDPIAPSLDFDLPAQSAPPLRPALVARAQPVEARPAARQAPAAPPPQQQPPTALKPAAPAPPPTAAAAPAPIAPKPPTARTPAPPLAPVDEPLTFSDDSGSLPAIDPLVLDADEPLELFDETADQLDAMPDTLEELSDVTSVFAGPRAPEPFDAPPAPPPTPTGRSAPPAGSPFAGPSPAANKAAAPPPAATGRPRVTPPPPPRTAPLRSFTGAGQTPARRGPEGPEIPPFGGAGPSGGRPPARGAVSGGFDGLATPPVREADVFSHTAFPSAGDAIFGSPSGEPPVIPPVTRKPGIPAGPPAGDAGPAGAPGAPVPARRDASGRRREAIPPNRQAAAKRQKGSAAPPPPPPAAAAGEPADPQQPSRANKRKPWWKSIGFVFTLMIVVLVGTLASIVFGFRPHSLVQGTLRVQGADRLGGAGRAALLKRVRDSLGRDDVRRVATGNLGNGPAHLDPGFTDDPRAIRALADPSGSRFDEARGAIVLTHTTDEPEADAVRMKALLIGLWTENAAMADRAAAANEAFGRARSAVQDLESRHAAQSSRVDRASAQVKALAGDKSAADAIIRDPARTAPTIEQDGQRLRQALDQATEALAARNAALARAQQMPAAGTSAPPAAAGNADGDPQAAQSRRSLNELEARLEADRAARGGQANAAARAYEDALRRFDLRLSEVPAAGDPKVADAIARVQRIEDEVRQINDAMIRQHREDGQAVARLQRELGQQRDARLRETWAADEQLRQLTDEREAQARRYGATADSGYADEAAKIQGVLDDLDQKIDARRKALATGGGPARAGADAATQTVQSTTERMERQWARDDRRVHARLDELAQAAADLDAARSSPAPAGSATFAAQVAGLRATRDAYAAATLANSGDHDGDLQRLHTAVAEGQAGLDARRRELADAAAQSLSASQREARQAAIDAAQQAVTAARADAARAAAAWDANRALLAAAQELRESRANAAELAEKLRQARADLDERRVDVDATPVILPPDDAAVATIGGPDPRVNYILVAGAAILALFAGPLWMGLRAQEHAAGSADAAEQETPAFAPRGPVVVEHEVFGLPDPLEDEGDEDYIHDVPAEDDAHPAAMA